MLEYIWISNEDLMEYLRTEGYEWEYEVEMQNKIYYTYEDNQPLVDLMDDWVDNN